jgi:hypothetical protein
VFLGKGFDDVDNSTQLPEQTAEVGPNLWFVFDHKGAHRSSLICLGEGSHWMRVLRQIFTLPTASPLRESSSPRHELGITQRRSSRIVSVTQIRLYFRKSVRSFNGIICDDISEFESYMYMCEVPLWTSTQATP